MTVGAVDAEIMSEKFQMLGADVDSSKVLSGLLMKDNALLHHKTETLENISKMANLHVLDLIEEISRGKSCLCRKL